ncbi:PPE family protein [[Mycobacterium] holstebronense]|uniref:PPE family protein n=1 Tax=[Mycobacterium] holstebronense TaxID=3064288 RepID=A0ABM9LZM6_9MYCO|nr:PPE family protein [Mycolicibacter sp. MU0102]CAJ1507532.1 PPE family protein [Mycolicibacter sp. MU0102]
MNYLSLPPEVTSTMIYSGPGSEPMVVAASAWSALAAELKSAAAEYRAVINQLTSEEWLGTASASMATAAAPYINWMELTAAQAEQAATQGRSAAAAYETAHAQTVPPVAVTANRELLQQLVATNILGQNTPSIAATETEHNEMWAQDTMAMVGYHSQSSAATQLNEFTSPPNPTNPSGDAANANAVAAANGTATATKASSTLQNLLTPNAAPSTGNPAQDILNDPNYNLTNQLMNQVVTNSNLQSNNVCAVWRGVSGVLGLQKLFADGAKAAAPAAASAASGAASGAASAASGAAGAVGGLSVPAAWVPPMAAASALGPVSGGSWVPVGPAAAAALPSAGGILGGAPIAPPTGMPGMPGIPAAGAAGAGFRGFGGPRYGTALTVMPRRPFGG